jgi:hypothetical protein
MFLFTVRYSNRARRQAEVLRAGEKPAPPVPLSEPGG